MTVGEKIVFFSSMVTFLVTIFGWLFTYRTQKNILEKQLQNEILLTKLQEKIGINRELIQYVLPEKLSMLKEIEDWFEIGRRIWHEAFTLSEQKSYENVVSHFDDFRKLELDLRKLRTITPRLVYLARQIDPEFKLDQIWMWGDSVLPKDVPLIMDAFEDEVVDQVNEALLGKTGRSKLFIVDQFYSLHQAGHNAIVRVKKAIIDQTKAETT